MRPPTIRPRGGAGLIGGDGRLLGIGSLVMQQQDGKGRRVDLNMVVPASLLPPILEDLLTYGRPNRPARPWLGLYAREDESDQVVIIGLAGRGPAQKADLHVGDVVHAVAGAKVSSLAEFYRGIWALGDAGVDVPLTLEREGDRFDVTGSSRGYWFAGWRRGGRPAVGTATDEARRGGGGRRASRRGRSATSSRRCA